MLLGLDIVKYTYLNGQLSCRAKDDCLDFSLTKQIFTPQIFRDRKTEGQSLATAREIARNHVLTIVGRIKGVLLYGEQSFDAPSDELLS